MAGGGPEMGANVPAAQYQRRLAETGRDAAPAAGRQTPNIDFIKADSGGLFLQKKSPRPLKKTLTGFAISNVQGG